MGHININSLPNKYVALMNIVNLNLDTFLISETKIDDSFPDAQFTCNGYSKPYRKDRKLGGGGLLCFVNNNIPSRQLNIDSLPNDIEIISIELNLRKQKWLCLGIYHPPNQDNQYFLDEMSKILDFYSSSYENIFIMGDFNMEPKNQLMDNFLQTFNLYNLVKEPTCYKGDTPKCIYLMLTNKKHSFKNTITVKTELSDFH